MSTTEEIKSCPACGYCVQELVESQADCKDEMPCSVNCGDTQICEMAGPRRSTMEAAVEAWNAMPRRDEIYLELMRVGATADALLLRGKIITLSEKYAPEDGG